MSEREAPPDMDVLSLDSGDEGVMVGGKEDMFASAISDPPQADSPPPDSGLADTLDTDQVATDNNVTPSSDTMEDLSLQEEEVPVPTPEPVALKPVDDDDIFSSSVTPPAVANQDDEDDLFKSAAPPPFKEAAPAAQAVPAPAVQPEVKDDLFSSSAVPVEKEIDLEDDDDDDIFKSARLEPEPAKVMGGPAGVVTNGATMPEEPAEMEIPLEEEENKFAAPELQLTSFRDEEVRREMEGGDEFIEVKVTSPHKVGEGMSSYMAYTVTTSTNLTYFKKKNPAVNRRFSDFLGLRDKLAEKYLQNGRIIPPAPDKSVIGMTKVKMSKEDEDAAQSEFVEKRRAALERYLNRTAGHPNLRVDPDFREFLELDAELPKSNQTSALSGKNVMKMISKVGDRVSAYTTKMEETDTWFEEKTVTIENLDNQLRKLHVATEAMVEYRKTLSGHTYSLSKSLAMLGSAEDNSKLSAALAQLAEVEEKVEKVHEQQAKDDFYLMSELVRDYVGIVGSVREAFQERVKAWQSWQGVQRDLNKRREAKVKAELGGKQDRVNTLRQEIAENERQVDMAQENFEKISRIIRKEFEAFDIKKCQDFKQTILQYLEQMLKSQESLVTHWERFLPEIKQMEP